jgi:hypothetical protein
MPDPISGDIVTTADGAEHVVVDVEEVAVVGHLDHLPGWEEYEPGKWRQT